MDVDTICKAICFSDFDNDQLVKIFNAVKYRRSQLGFIKRNMLTIGCDVKFVNSRTGNVVKGKVSKINQKYVIVDAGVNRWRVPASMLETV